MATIPALVLQQPEDIPRHFATAWNEKDARKLAGVFSEDADFVNVTGLWWHDRDAIFRAHDYGLRVIFAESTLSVRQTRVRKIGDQVAVVQARFKLIGQSGQGKTTNPGDRMTILTFVVEKRREGWVCVTAHNTDIVPGKETHIVDEEGNLKTADYRQ
jgi:uncharacterized protein (TIGR02246 family)